MCWIENEHCPKTVPPYFTNVSLKNVSTEKNREKTFKSQNVNWIDFCKLEPIEICEIGTSPDFSTWKVDALKTCQSWVRIIIKPNFAEVKIFRQNLWANNRIFQIISRNIQFSTNFSKTLNSDKRPFFTYKKCQENICSYRSHYMDK